MRPTADTVISIVHGVSRDPAERAIGILQLTGSNSQAMLPGRVNPDIVYKENYLYIQNRYSCKNAHVVFISPKGGILD